MAQEHLLSLSHEKLRTLGPSFTDFPGITEKGVPKVEQPGHKMEFTWYGGKTGKT